MQYKILNIFIIIILFNLIFLEIINGNGDESKISTFLEIFEYDFGLNIKNLINIKSSNSTQLLSVELSTSFCGLIIFDSKYFNTNYINNNETQTNEKFSIHNYKGKIIFDDIEICGIKKENVKILLVQELLNNKKISNKIDGILGLGNNCKENYDEIYSFDILSYFSSKKIFYVHVNKYLMEVEIDKNPIKKINNLRDKYFYLTVPLNNNNNLNNNRFEVFLHLVYFSNGNFFRIKENISLGLSGMMISTSIDFFNFVIKEFFMDDYNNINENCYLNKTNVYEIYCNSNFNFNNNETISFVFGKWNLKFELNDLFVPILKNNVNYKFFAIVCYPEQDKWYISIRLIYRTFIIFDKNKNEIGIIHRDRLIKPY